MDEVIRVLHVVTTMNRGGLESMIMNYYRNIDRTKIQFDFLIHRPKNEKNDFGEEIKLLGGRIFHISRLNPFSIEYFNGLNRFFKKHKEYSIIHVHQDCMSGIILKVAKKNGIKVRIAHCHSSSQDKNLKYIIKYIYRHNIKKYANKMFSCGEISGKWMFCTDNFEILPNAIDAERYRYNKNVRNSVRRELGFDDDDFVIGHVGRFSKVKNQAFLVSVFECIHHYDKSAKLVFAGTGEEENNIKRIVYTKKLTDCVKFLGLRQDIERLLQAYDVFVLPSKYEGLPVTMIEAQATGLPCIISDKVPIECDITGNVVSICLNSSLKKWAKSILYFKKFHRQDTYDKVSSSRYDIKDNANYLMNYYLSALRMNI